MFVDWRPSLLVNYALRIYSTFIASQNPVLTYLMCFSNSYKHPCGGLNETGHHRRLCLKTWPPVDRTNWEGLGRKVSLGAGFEISKVLDYFQCVYSCLVVVSRCEFSVTAPVPCAMLLACCHVPIMMVMDSIPPKVVRLK